MTKVTIDIKFEDDEYYHEFRKVEKKCNYKRLLEDIYTLTKYKIKKDD